MKRLAVITVLLGIIAANAFAHNTHALTKMGTVKMVQGNALTLKMSDGDLEKVTLSDKTTYVHADDHPATRVELAAGMRVVVKMTADGKSVASVKMSPGTKKK